jgi:hypothetical protein
MKIGLIGEAPGDTRAIQNLLSKHYQHLDFVTLLKDINGSMLDNKKAVSQLLPVEFDVEKPDVVIFIRDLDSHEKDKKKLLERMKTFTHSNRIVNNAGVFLLNIYELEALILADIDVFNKEYNGSVEQFPDPMKVPMPKEILIEATRKAKKRYIISHNPQLFNLLNIETLRKNCRYFSDFIKEFDKALM